MMSYQVEQTYTNGAGTVVRLFPKRYKTRRNAEKAAQRLSWVTKPDGVTELDCSIGRVVDLG